MKFRKESIDAFKTIFSESEGKIKACSGCIDVKLLQDKNDQCILFTLSLWQSHQHLEEYRASELFKSTWAKTKILFDAKPEAWSLEEGRGDRL